MNTLYKLLIFSGVLLSSCKKQDEFLKAVPNDVLVIPKTLNDLQLLLQNDAVFNQNDPVLRHASSDEFYVLSADWVRILGFNHNAYVWDKDTYAGAQSSDDWSYAYNEVYNANIVLDALPTMERKANDGDKYNSIKGTALYFRSYTFYNLLQTFAQPYDSVSASSTLGIPLRLNSDLTGTSTRASLEQSYQQTIADLKLAMSLLPSKSLNIEQPTSLAAEGLLARIYLIMGKYTEAFTHANSVLSKYNALADYSTFNEVNGRLTDSPFPLPEMLCLTTMQNVYFASYSKGIVDSVLYASYDSNDLRKTFFFQKVSNQIRFRGNYQFKQGGYFFDGVATDELYLIRAECFARLGNTAEAMADINKLLKTRWRKNPDMTSTYVDMSAASPDEALKIVLMERRKELFFRGLRWSDLRRLNKDPRFAVTLTRFVNNTTYTLPPNDPRYTFPIPQNEIDISGIQQNPR